MESVTAGHCSSLLTHLQICRCIHVCSLSLLCTPCSLVTCLTLVPILATRRRCDRDGAVAVPAPAREDRGREGAAADGLPGPCAGGDPPPALRQRRLRFDQYPEQTAAHALPGSVETGDGERGRCLQGGLEWKAGGDVTDLIGCGVDAGSD